MSIFKDCDIRGRYPDEIDEAAAWRVGRAMASLHPGAAMGVGGDVRLSTPALKAALIRGLVEGGVHVKDLGMIPTPALYFSMKRYGLPGGATVTASHNPPRFNGIKFMFGDMPVTRADIDALQDICARGDFPSGQGDCEPLDPIPDYLDALAKRFAGQRPMKVVVDAGSGALSAIAPEAFRRCGHEVVELFCEADGRFPMRDPNPAEYSHLGAVRAKVVEAGADFGVAFDGDGDRAVFITEAGVPVLNEQALTLFIRHLLKNRPTPVVYDQKCSSVVPRAVRAMGGQPAPERSGHAFIKRRFLQIGAAIAGEVSGHFFFGELGYDDGLFAALTMAELLAESVEPLSVLADGIVCPPITPDLRVHCPYAAQDACIDHLVEKAKAMDCRISRLDGVRLEFDDGWLLLRKSVTAEQITIRAEADTQERLREILALAASALPEDGARAILAW